MEERTRTAEYGRRTLLLIACGYAAALLLAHYLLPPAYQLPAALCALVLCLPAALWKRQRAACFLLLLSAVAGFLWYWGYGRLFSEPAEAFVGETRTVRVRVTDYPDVYVKYNPNGGPDGGDGGDGAHGGGPDDGSADDGSGD